MSAYTVFSNCTGYTLCIVFMLDLIIILCLFCGKYMVQQLNSKYVKYIQIGLSSVFLIVSFLFVE